MTKNLLLLFVLIPFSSTYGGEQGVVGGEDAILSTWNVTCDFDDDQSSGQVNIGHLLPERTYRFNIKIKNSTKTPFRADESNTSCGCVTLNSDRLLIEPGAVGNLAVRVSTGTKLGNTGRKMKLFQIQVDHVRSLSIDVQYKIVSPIRVLPGNNLQISKGTNELKIAVAPEFGFLEILPDSVSTRGQILTVAGIDSVGRGCEINCKVDTSNSGSLLPSSVEFLSLTYRDSRTKTEHSFETSLSVYSEGSRLVRPDPLILKPADDNKYYGRAIAFGAEIEPGVYGIIDSDGTEISDACTVKSFGSRHLITFEFSNTQLTPNIKQAIAKGTASTVRLGTPAKSIRVKLKFLGE